MYPTAQPISHRDTWVPTNIYWFMTHTCAVPSGNWIILASKQPNVIDEAELKVRAKALSKQFGYSVSENLHRLYQVHPKE